MKVLQVITGLGVGGAELQLRSMLRHTRHETDVVTLYNPGAVADMIVREGTRVRDLGMRRNTELPALTRLRRMVREGRYDVVHTHLYRSCVYGKLAARAAGAPVVIGSEHSIGETHLERRRMTPAVRALYLGSDLCADATIAVSDTVRERLLAWGMPARKIEVISNGLDFDRVAFRLRDRERLRAEFDIPPGAQVIGVLGRLEENKRFDLVMQAAAPLLDANVRLVITGKGAEGERLVALAESLGVGEYVVFTGERNDVAAVLSTLDVFVAPSRQETFGLSVLEALANGLPALYTTCPALDGIETGRARAVPGDVTAMREALAAELSCGPRERTPVAAVRERYGIESVTDRIDGLYERTMAARARGGAPVAGAIR